MPKKINEGWVIKSVKSALQVDSLESPLVAPCGLDELWVLKALSTRRLPGNTRKFSEQ